MALSGRKSPTAVLPEGHHVAVTWDIPDKFGGLTKAMLQRSCLFAQHADVTVDVLTFALQPRLNEIRTDLRERGLLVGGVTLVNMWEELRDFDQGRLRQAEFDPAVTAPRKAPDGEPDVLIADGEPIARVYRPSGSSAVVEILRADGSVLARQSWITLGDRAPLTTLGDWATHTELWSRDGVFLGGWNGSWGLWNFWLTQRLGKGHTYAIVDSAYVGGYFAHAHLPRCTSMFVFHNNHLLPNRLPPFGPIGRWRRHAAENLCGFGGTVFLTHQQLDDFETLMGAQANAHVIPNAKSEPTNQSGVKRDKGRGIVMANLEGRKRLDHAIRAIDGAAKTTPGVSLHIYGEGPRRPSLSALIEELSAPAVLEGYTSSPEDEYAKASFMVLSSINEGLPLVLAEAMAHGCIPIAYDIPYGPADVITHGVDGYLVPAADHKAMAKQISEFVATGRWRTAGMRRAAKRRAGDFSAPPVIGRWRSAFLAADAYRHAQVETPVSAEQFGVAEHLAMIHRLTEPVAQIEFIDASWQGMQNVTLTLRCSLTGGLPEERSHNPAVTTRLVDRTDGTSQEFPVQLIPGLRRVGDPEGTVYVNVTLDLSVLDVEANHVIMATVSEGNLAAMDTVMLRRRIAPWLPMPEAALSRPVLEFTRNRGIALVSAAPKVAADASVNGAEVSLTVTSFIEGTVQTVEAVGLGNASTVEATRAADGTFRLPFDTDGRWKLQAIVDSQRHEIAWAGGSNELPALPRNAAGIRLELTPRGYLRVDRSPGGPELIDVSVERGFVLTVAGAAENGSPVLVETKAGGASPFVASEREDRWTIDCTGLAPGTYRLRWRAQRETDVPASDEVQDRLPLRSTVSGATYELIRQHDRNACRIVVSG